jgi:hypothetical protein
VQFAVSIFTGVQRHVNLLLADEKFFIDSATQSRVPFPAPFSEPETAKDNIYLSVIFPAYNEEERMPSTIEETLLYLKQRSKKDSKFTWEIIIVDDGSRDATFKARSLHAVFPLFLIRCLTILLNISFRWRWSFPKRKDLTAFVFSNWFAIAEREALSNVYVPLQRSIMYSRLLKAIVFELSSGSIRCSRSIYFDGRLGQCHTVQ